jgi:hypothetical protein
MRTRTGFAHEASTLNKVFGRTCDRLVGESPPALADHVRRKRGEQEVSVAAREPMAGVKNRPIVVRQARAKLCAFEGDPSFFRRPEGRGLKVWIPRD